MKNKFKRSKVRDKAYNLFNKESNPWWENLKKLFTKDTGHNKSDPEFNAQNIYQHWIKSYLGK